MSSTNIKILKQCLNCGNMFEAQKTTTKYCSHKCNSQHYKLRKRLELKKEIEVDTKVKINKNFKAKTSQIDLLNIKDKEYLSVREVAYLLNCNTKTIYRLIKSKRIKSTNLNERLTRIKKSEVEKLF